MKIIRGHTYRAKKPGNVAGCVNDRTVIHISELGNTLQYDGPAIARGRHYPSVFVHTFEAWAEEDVTDQLTGDEYLSWEDYLASKRAKVAADVAKAGS